MAVWIGASYALGREVTTDEPYPHICGNRVAGRMTPGLTVRIGPPECAACAADRAARRQARRDT